MEATFKILFTLGGFCTHYSLFNHTVGAQSIEPAQSIAHGQSATVSVKKTKFLKNFFLQKIKNGKLSSRFLNKILQF
jgi:hypothetical protein